MSKKQAVSPAYEIKIYQTYADEKNWYVGEFYKDGVLCFSTGEPNSFALVYARLEPWLAQAPYTSLPQVTS